MSLRSFLAEMEKKGQLFQVDDGVSPRFEVSAFMKELDGGPIPGLTTKVGVDATKPLTKPREKFEPATIPTGKRISESIAQLKKRVERKQS